MLRRRVVPVAAVALSGTALPLTADADRAEARPDYKCWALTQDQIVFVPGEGYWLCVCLSFEDPSEDPDVICDWIIVPQSSYWGEGIIYVPHNGEPLNVGGASSISGNTGINDSSAYSFDDSNWEPGVITQPPGELAVRNTLWKWNGQSWQVCRDSGFVYNQVTNYAINVSRQWGVHPCGYGYYENVTSAFAWHQAASSWKGGGIPSGPLYWIPPGLTEIPEPPMIDTSVTPPPVNPSQALLAERPQGIVVTEGPAPVPTGS